MRAPSRQIYMKKMKKTEVKMNMRQIKYIIYSEGDLLFVLLTLHITPIQTDFCFKGERFRLDPVMFGSRKCLFGENAERERQACD